MSIQTTLEEDVKTAMRAKDEGTVSTLRMLRAALKYKQIEAMHELTDEETLVVIKSEMKKLKDGLDSFVSAGRAELADRAKAELVTLEKYLPAQMPEAELEVIVRRAIETSGAKGKADMGRAMGVVMKEVGGRADGNAVRKLVEQLLAQ